MRLSILTLAAVIALVAASDASACHKRRACATPCADVVAVPCPPPAPVCEPACAPRKKCFGGMKLFGHRNRGRQVCASAPAPCYGGGEWAPAPAVYPTGQAHGSHQGY